MSNYLLTQSQILREAELLLRASGLGLDVGDLSFHDDSLRCKDVPGGILVGRSVRELSLDDFSQTILVPWLARMARLKALREDLKALGVVRDD